AYMSVEAAGSGSTVKIVTDYHVAGRVASFGRGVMEDVSKRIVKDMAACIKANLEAAPPGGSPASDAAARSSPSPNPPPAATAQQINALSLFFHLLAVRVQRLFGRRV
ncbi:MAG TPA: hypothetical protein VGE99_05395, partial [Candidatus Dormibacteraeota bacterium]